MTITVNAAGAGETWSAGGADFRILADGSAVDGRWAWWSAHSLLDGAGRRNTFTASMTRVSSSWPAP